MLTKAQAIIEAGIRSAKTAQARSQLDSIFLCTEGYAEPGYTGPDSGVIALGNWNSISKYNGRTFDDIDDSPARVATLLERLGVELEWSDEWTVCDECGKAVRTKPDSYRWQRYSWEDEYGTTVCGECVEADPSDYLETHEGHETRCLTIDIDPADHGYILLEEGFEHGLHYGQDADPSLIAEALRKQGIERFLFMLDGTGQFDISFSVFVHKSECGRLDLNEWEAAVKDGPSVSDGLRRALVDAGDQMHQLQDAPITVAKCDVATGTARVRGVSAQEFVEGRALDF